MVGCQSIEEGKVYCARPTRAIIFIERENKGKTGQEIVRYLRRASNRILEDDSNCTECELYSKIKEDYNKLFQG